MKSKRVMKIRFLIITGCFILIFGCAHQEDVIILDKRLSRVETLSKKLDERTAGLEEKTVALDRQRQVSRKELEEDRSRLSSKIAATEEFRKEEDLKLRNQYGEMKSI